MRTVGKVTYDETRIAHVHTRVDGWIEKVFVDFTGDFVKQGQPMLTVYSPEMLASQQELLLAARARDLMRDNPLASARRARRVAVRRREAASPAVGSQRRPDRAGARNRQPIRSVTLHSPVSGFVTERNAFPNQNVTPDSDLYTIADLSRIWIMADVFEADITSIRIGGSGVRHPFPTAARRSTARKSTTSSRRSIPTTRTLKVRLDAANPGMRLKPDMFVNVEFGVPRRKQLTVPADAVLDTGGRQTVFVDLGDGYLEPRQVAVGERIGDRVAITQRPVGRRARRGIRHVPHRFGEPAEGRGERHGRSAAQHVARRPRTPTRRRRIVDADRSRIADARSASP